MQLVLSQQTLEKALALTLMNKIINVKSNSIHNETKKPLYVSLKEEIIGRIWCYSLENIVFQTDALFLLERDRGTKKGRTTTTNQQTFTKGKENLEYF